MAFDKRGLSSVVATLLLVLITVAAVSIIAGIFIPFVKENIGKGAECFKVGEYYSFYNEEFEVEGERYKFNCYTEDKNYYVSIKAGALDNETTQEIKGFYLVFSKADKSKAFEVYDGAKYGELSMVKGQNLKDPNLVIPIQGAIKTYVFQGDDEYEKVGVITNLKSDECKMKSEITLSKCSSNIE